MREPIVKDFESLGVRIDVNPSVSDKALVWLNVRAWKSGFSFDIDLTPDEADALADGLREQAHQSRKAKAEIDANAVITAAGMVA